MSKLEIDDELLGRIDQIPIRVYRQAVRQFFVDETSLEDIASGAGIDVSSAHYRIRKGVESITKD